MSLAITLIFRSPFTEYSNFPEIKWNGYCTIRVENQPKPELIQNVHDLKPQYSQKNKT